MWKSAVDTNFILFVPGSVMVILIVQMVLMNLPKNVEQNRSAEQTRYYIMIDVITAMMVTI